MRLFLYLPEPSCWCKLSICPSPRLIHFLHTNRALAPISNFLTWLNSLLLKASPSSRLYEQGQWRGTLALCNSSAPVGNSGALSVERKEGNVRSLATNSYARFGIQSLYLVLTLTTKNALIEKLKLQLKATNDFISVFLLFWQKWMLKTCWLSTGCQIHRPALVRTDLRTMPTWMK